MKTIRLILLSLLFLGNFVIKAQNPGKHFHNIWKNTQGKGSLSLYQNDNCVKVINTESSGCIANNKVRIQLYKAVLEMTMSDDGSTINVVRDWYVSEIQDIVAKKTGKKLREVNAQDVQSYKSANPNDKHRGVYRLALQEANQYNDKDNDGITDQFDIDNRTPAGFHYSKGNVDIRGRSIEKITKTDKKKRPKLNINIVSTNVYKPGKIEIEENPYTGTAYTGITADGNSTIKFELEIYGANEVYYSMPFGKGDFKLTTGEGSVNDDPLKNYIYLKDNKATVYFHPPKKVLEEWFTKQIPLKGTKRTLWVTDVPIRFEYTDSKGKQVVNHKLLLTKTPVMLIHGFTGDGSTWQTLDSLLTIEKYHTHRKVYYAWTKNEILQFQDVNAQSRKLGEYILDEIKSLESSGIRTSKFDAVCHSMGGLIARNYMKNTKYSKFLKKIIMVGTPNHGIKSKIDFLLGYYGAVSAGDHHGMLMDVYYNSKFMKFINSGENSGNHLNPNVQYGNIFVYPDDWVTKASSADLNGVTSFTLYDARHSPAIPMDKQNPSITTWTKVHTKIISWLKNDIERVPLKNMKIKLYRAEGDIFIKKPGSENYSKIDVNNLPMEIENYDYIKSSENTKNVRIVFYLNDKSWSGIALDKNSEIKIETFSPSLMEIEMIKGRARFKSRKEDNSHFYVNLYPDNYSDSKWWQFNPKAKIIGLNTEFTITKEISDISVDCFEGKLNVTEGTANNKKLVNENGGVKISNNIIFEKPIDNSIWWNKDIDDLPEKDDQPIINEKINPFTITSSGSATGKKNETPAIISWSPDGEFKNSLSGDKCEFGYSTLSLKCNLPKLSNSNTVKVSWFYGEQLLTSADYKLNAGQEFLYDKISTNGEPLNPGNYFVKIALNNINLFETSLTITQPNKLNVEQATNEYIKSLQELQNALSIVEQGNALAGGIAAEKALPGLRTAFYSAPNLDDIQAVYEMAQALIAMKTMTIEAENKNIDKTLELAKITYAHAVKANNTVIDSQFKITTQNLVNILESLFPEFKN